MERKIIKKGSAEPFFINIFFTKNTAYRAAGRFTGK